MIMSNTIKVTPELLDARDETINLALVTGSIADIISDIIDGEIEYYSDTFYEEVGIYPDEYCDRYGLDFWEEVSWDYRAMFDKAWPIVAEALKSVVDEVFSEDVVSLGDYIPSDSRPATGLWGQEREVAMFPLKINGEALARLYKDNTGRDSVRNGKDISGFIRTCDDNYWVQLVVLWELLPIDFWYYIFDWLQESCVIGDMVTFGALEKAREAVA